MTRWTERRLADANFGLPDDKKHGMRMFNQFVHIQLNYDVEKKVKDFMDKIDRIIPRRRIQRRHSVLNLGEVLPNNQVEAQNAVLPVQNAVLPLQNAVRTPFRKRNASVDARMYLAPPEMQSTINLLRQKDGVLKYESSFHSVQQKRARVAGIGPSTSTSTSTSTVDVALGKFFDSVFF